MIDRRGKPEINWMYPNNQDTDQVEEQLALIRIRICKSRKHNQDFGQSKEDLLNLINQVR